ncbi:MAG: hypothetical protein LCH54_17010 [Bacteroidetes bacterium]|nr:hypothetical protein [Bacteroidota bacterium]
MKLFLNSLAFFLLLLNGTGAIYGGWLLISSPDGSSLQLPLDYLKSSPFETYLIPGLILFTVNGLFSFLTLLLMILKNKKAPWFILAQGILLTGWILVQVILIQVFHPFQLIFGLTGIILAGIGWYGKAQTKTA